jgi:uncharacterized protein
MIEVGVARIGLDSSSNAYVVILQEKGGERLLPIWIGQPEAESIVMQMHKLRRERPLTHDLCKNIIQGLGGELRRVTITRVEKSTYFAELHVHRDGQIVHIDARPSDSIAIALRFAAPIFASDELLTEAVFETDEASDESGPTLEVGGTSDPQGLTPEQLQRYLEQLRPEDFGKFNP